VAHDGLDTATRRIGEASRRRYPRLLIFGITRFQAQGIETRRAIGDNDARQASSSFSAVRPSAAPRPGNCFCFLELLSHGRQAQ